MKTFKFKSMNCRLAVGRYREPSNTAVTLQVWDKPDGGYWEPYATLSINIRQLDMRSGEFVANHDCTALVAELAELGLVEPTGERLSYGYIEGQPVYRLTARGLETSVED